MPVIIPNWDSHFAQDEYVFGEEPNVYFKEELDKLEVGKILLPAEGEGRNGVYAAKKGWKVFAFDQSMKGKAKAEKLAQKHGVTLDYGIADLGTASYTRMNSMSLHSYMSMEPKTKRNDSTR
ncbi:Uncharacterized protein FKW44_012666, partial [Caligus rogercresseyi]